MNIRILDSVVLSGLTYFPIDTPNVVIININQLSQEITLIWNSVLNANSYKVQEMPSPYGNSLQEYATQEYFSYSPIY